MTQALLRMIKAMSRSRKRAVLLALDCAAIALALIFVVAVSADRLPAREALVLVLPILPYLVALGAGLSYWLGLADIQLKSYELRAAAKTGVFAIYAAAAAAGLAWLFGIALPPGLFVDYAMALFVMSGASRVVMYQLLLAIYRRDRTRCRVLIYGAGNTGLQMAAALRAHDTIEPVAFVDDNLTLQGILVAGLPVYAPAQIQRLVAQKRVDRVLLAIPSLSQPHQARIARRLQDLGLEVQTLPSFSQLIGEEPILDRLTPVRPTDFLRRAPLEAGPDGGRDFYADRVIMISGAGGSIGAELARQLLAFRPQRLVLFDLSEYALYAVEMDLRALADASGTEMVPILGSVTDARQARQAIAAHGVEIVLHAAAYKHVGLVEANPLAGLSNNVLGTHVLARAAAEAGVRHFILVSSDKAVRPTSVMGASKRLAEQVVLDLATRGHGTVFSIVRFGNVLGSSGSVVPLFQEQIRRGGPVTVTDPDVKRFFMTIREAVHLVLRTAAMARGGEVFVLDMGEPIPIVQLARSVIERTGYTVRDEADPDGDIEIEFTGLRTGEKLVEELTLEGEHVRTSHPKIFCAREPHLSEIELAAALRGVRDAVETGDAAAALQILDRFVEGPAPAVAERA